VNPINRFSVKRATAKEGESRRVRRALQLAEVRRLLEVVEANPLKMASQNSGGRGAKLKPRTRDAKLRPATVDALKQRGRERRLLYRIALLTGLRRKEIARLRVMHLVLAADGNGGSRIILPGTLTKN
jgi:integrase